MGLIPLPTPPDLQHDEKRRPVKATAKENSANTGDVFTEDGSATQPADSTVTEVISYTNNTGEAVVIEGFGLSGGGTEQSKMSAETIIDTTGDGSTDIEAHYTEKQLPANLDPAIRVDDGGSVTLNHQPLSALSSEVTIWAFVQIRVV